MTVAKSERLLNLLIMLLVQRRYVPKERIREILYPDSTPEAFEKMFERDKEELRSLGVPVEVGQMDALFDDEPGYRIRPDDFALPEIDLHPDEAAVIGLATQVWQHARLAEATTEAVRKLTAAGVDVDLTALDIVEPRLSADEPSFDVFWEATQERSAVVFDYARAGEDTAPAAACSRGAWCATPGAGTSWASTSTAARSGSSGSPGCRARPGAPAGPAPTTSRPAPTCARWPAAWRRRRSAEHAVLLVRAGRRARAAPRRRHGRGRRARPRRPAPAGTGSSLSRSLGLVDEVLGHGADVVVEAPDGAPARGDRAPRGSPRTPAAAPPPQRR